jgi:membrane fusion protein (multidrug efflux system)
MPFPQLTLGGVIAVRRQLFALAVASSVLVACSDGGKPAAPGAAPGAPGQAPMALPVSIIAAQPTRVPVSLEAVAQAEGAREVEVRARVSGILEKRLYVEGQAVKAGQALFRIERAPYEIALAQAKAQLAEQQARAAQAAREAARLSGLVAERAISQKEFDDASAGNAIAKANVRAAEAAVRQAELNLSYTSVTAPVAGMSGRALHSEGALVSPGADGQLASIVQLDPIWVRFSIAESDVAKLGVAKLTAASIRHVEAILPDGSTYPTKGKLNFTASRVDPALGTIEMRAEFPNAEGRILPGQFLRARLIAGDKDNVFLVPQAAVMQTDQGRVVMLANDKNEVEPRPVTAGEWAGKDWVITAGLKAGDRVIVDNLLKLRPGAPVAPHPAGEAPTAPQAKPAS